VERIFDTAKTMKGKQLNFESKKERKKIKIKEKCLVCFYLAVFPLSFLAKV
jgi:hypothetical protein